MPKNNEISVEMCHKMLIRVSFGLWLKLIQLGTYKKNVDNTGNRRDVQQLAIRATRVILIYRHKFLRFTGAMPCIW